MPCSDGIQPEDKINAFDMKIIKVNTSKSALGSSILSIMEIYIFPLFQSFMG